MHRRGHAATVAFAVIAVATGALLGLSGWPAAQQTNVFSSVILAAVAVAAFAVRPAVADDWTITPLFWIVALAAQLILGRDAATVVALAGAVVCILESVPRPRPAVH